MIKDGATHIAVATDHVIESFRNELWPGYKTSEGVEPDLLAQFPLLEEVLAAAGVGGLAYGGEQRFVPLNSIALAMLNFLQSRTPEIEGDHVFLSMNNEPLTGNRHWFEDAVKKAGIRGFTWHDLRHTFASRLVMAGVDVRRIQELMGHKTIQMTCRYAHLAPVDLLAAVEKLIPQPSATTGATGPEGPVSAASRVVQ